MRLKKGVCLDPYTRKKSYVWPKVHHLFDISRFDEVKKVTKKEVHFLNQISGPTLFGFSIDYKSVVNKTDGCYKFATRGPDNILTMRIHPNTVKKMLSKVLLDEDKVAIDKSSMRHDLSTIFYKHSTSKHRKLIDQHKRKNPFFMKPPKWTMPNLKTTIYIRDPGKTK